MKRRRESGAAALPASPERAERSTRFASMAKVAEEFKAFRPASEVLTVVKAVPTIFPQFDHATRVGGLPIERFTLLHGESAGGKTYLTIGFLLSFLMRDHLAVLIDAERTTPKTWLEKTMGEYAGHPFFRAERPETYEETVAKVRDFLKTVRAMRDAGKLPEKTSALVVVDSIRKLVPRDQWQQIMKAAKDGESAEKIRSRANQIKAAMNAAWMDEVVPLLDVTKSAMVVIAREIEDPDAAPARRVPGRPPPPKRMKTAGGGALFYDASLDLKASRVGFYGKKTKVGEGESLVPYGERYRVEVTKSKVSGKGEVFRASCEFHVSNGALVPEGFDRARDLIDVARRLGVVQGTGWLKYKAWKRQGEDLAVKDLAARPELFAEMEADVRSASRAKAEKSEVVE